ncbi:hypothetical protein FVE85_4846 [Porphyridium purpureum]|uniref:Uncharacterized protein n=1 Tax=Porphyridium purpureum TaxID=35688 RepID=A0A5J4YQH9_PORPP|nr:hypothetical protein FVE85_4846 [Porphyridium purpureum]|eukprot:POR8747..scf236_6
MSSSTQRGNAQRTRAQAHQNTHAFKHNKGSQKTKQIAQLPATRHCCQRCADVIEWRKNYRKYKPLTQPRKCIDCENKTVMLAYHSRCPKCAVQKNVCAKCAGSMSSAEKCAPMTKNEIRDILPSLRERDRRCLVRKLDRNEPIDDALVKRMQEKAKQRKGMDDEDSSGDYSSEDGSDTDDAGEVVSGAADASSSGHRSAAPDSSSDDDAEIL